MTARATGRTVRLALAFVFVACAVAAAPVGAGVPLSVRVDGGLGPGSARSKGVNRGGIASQGAADLQWRVGSSWALLVGARVGDVQEFCIGCSHVTGWSMSSDPTITGAGYHSFVVGSAWRRSAGVTPWLSGAMGMGRVEPEGRNQEGATDVAVDAALGLQIARDRGPVGLVLGVARAPGPDGRRARKGRHVRPGLHDCTAVSLAGGVGPAPADVS